MVQDRFRSEKYITSALEILNTLSSPKYLAIEVSNWEGILQHGIYHKAKGLGVDQSVMWGDYFFVEGLAKALSMKPLGAPW